MRGKTEADLLGPPGPVSEDVLRVLESARPDLYWAIRSLRRAKTPEEITDRRQHLAEAYFARKEETKTKNLLRRDLS